MATSYERVLEAARRYSRDPRFQELPRDTSGRQHAQCSCPAHDGDGGTSLHITYDQSNGKTMLHCFGAEHCDAASIAGALGLKIIDLFDQQSGPQGHAITAATTVTAAIAGSLPPIWRPYGMRMSRTLRFSAEMRQRRLHLHTRKTLRKSDSSTRCPNHTWNHWP